MRKAVFVTIIGMALSLGEVSWDGKNQAWASQIAFVSVQNPDPEICVINSDGTNLQNLTNSPELPNDWPTWSPDGKKIAFTGWPSNLYLMDADGSNMMLLNNNYSTRSRPTWSPDGTKILFAELFTLKILDLETGEEETLFLPADNGLRDPAWSPNGRQIAFTIRHGRQRDIHVINVDGTQLRQLTKHPAEDHAPAWSPGGRQIAFSSTRDNKVGICLMDADGANFKRLTDGGEDFPAWSPDGRQIAVTAVSGKAGNPLSVGVMSANGRNLKLLAVGQKPSWQPSGLAVNQERKLFSIWGLVK